MITAIKRQAAKILRLKLKSGEDLNSSKSDSEVTDVNKFVAKNKTGSEKLNWKIGWQKVLKQNYNVRTRGKKSEGKEVMPEKNRGLKVWQNLSGRKLVDEKSDKKKPNLNFRQQKSIKQKVAQKQSDSKKFYCGKLHSEKSNSNTHTDRKRRRTVLQRKIWRWNARWLKLWRRKKQLWKMSEQIFCWWKIRA